MMNQMTTWLKRISGKIIAGAILQLFIHALASGDSHAQMIKIGLFADQHVRSVVFSDVNGSYNISINGTFLMHAAPGDIYYAYAKENKIHLSNRIKEIGSFPGMELRQTGDESTFQLKPVSPVLFSADYDGDLILTPDGNALQIINQVDLEKYVSAVIEAEGGSNAHPEYYKAQAILVRTYALKNMYRHGAENYNLCSGVHCQSYKGRSMLNKQIYESTFLTKGLVLADKDNNLITAPYHSNCGGMTSSADIAWQQNLPCLVSIRDPFCAAGKNHSWSKQISVERWKAYLRSKGINTGKLSINHYLLSNSGRVKTYTITKKGIPMRKIREDLNLKSAYFQIHQGIGNNLILSGKGFGHGVGLCQEGAMEMAKVGYTYPDILHFYFQRVLIVNHDKILNQRGVRKD